jgi:cytochrome c biogenesis protein CcmG/thiol:disulfide interchange protein DsbE
MTDQNAPSQAAPAARRGPSAGTLFLGVGLFAVFAVIGLQLLRNNAQPPTSGPAPDFSMTLYEGGTFTLSEHRGQWVVVNFWGSWCGSCRDEAPELQGAWEAFRQRGVMVVGVGFRDVESAARQFIAENGITYPNGNDEGLRITARYAVTGAPETYIVAPDGTVQAFFIGPLPVGALAATLERLLTEWEART